MRNTVDSSAPPKRRLFPFILLFLAAAAAMAAVPTLYAVRLSRENAQLSQENFLLSQEKGELEKQTGTLTREVDDLQLQVKALEGYRKFAPDGQEHPAYQELYPDLYIEGTPAGNVREKTVFLTFDDGPSPRTDEVLAILEQEQVKATFFVVGPDTAARREQLQHIAAAGHTIGVHSASHEYKKIYASVESYLDDFYQVWTMVKEATGIAPAIFRFPGGSINSYNRGVYQEIIAEMLRRGFVYFDWNVSSGDATSKPLPAGAILQNVVQGAGKMSRPIVLMHDSSPRATTVSALPDMIAAFKARGYAFASLTRDDLPVTFGYPTLQS